jgi:hypothetical protein
MYDAAVDRNNFCLLTQTNVRRDELYEQPVPATQERCAMVAPRRLRRATPLRLFYRQWQQQG